tara:strand:+ start:1459 stop:1899 length:441 start_codon:yes stop_codon:yes gene_type:complete
MLTFDKNKGFDRYIDINIYIYGLFIIENEEDMLFNLKLNTSKFIGNENDNFEIFRKFIEDELKKYVILKIKEKCKNIVEISIKYNVPVKNILHSIFINNKIENIEIEWSPSSLKEFLYVPIKHYLEFHENNLILKTQNFRFHKYFS